MKNKFNIYILFIFSVLAFSSCEKYIDLQPTDVITDEKALVTLDDYQQALNATYGILTSSAYYGTNFTVYADIMSDNGRISSQNLGTGRAEHIWVYTAGSGLAAGYWSVMYKLIYRANVIINRIDKLEADVAVKNQILGEALMLRAIGHFDLVRCFAQRYKASADASHLGIPIITTIPDAGSVPARNTVAEVYTQVEKDLNDAKALMTSLSANATRLTPQAATALLARVALYKEDFAKAIQLTTEILNVRGLATGNDFKNMWTNDVVGECIFKVRMTTNEVSVGDALYDPALNLAFFNPTEDLLGLYDEVKDIRFNAFYLRRNGKESLVAKYFGRVERPNLNDIKVLRVAELYLIRAEAYLRSAQQTQAEADYNTLRNARINGNTPISSGSLTLDLLALERRRELAWEGHRWFDLIRFNQGIVRNDCNDINCTLTAGNFRFTLPIPQAEIFANKNIVQNQGYSN